MSNQSQVIVTNALTSEQQAKIEELRSLFKLGGVLVGALNGRGTSQVYPLILAGRQLYLLRMVEGVKPAWQALTTVLEKHAGNLGYTQLGADSGRIWYARPYHPNVLLDGQQIFTDWTDSEMRLALSRLVETFMAGLESGLAHGHIWAGNVGVDNRAFYLLDYLTAQVETSTDFDLQAVQLADLQTLGRVLKEFLPPSLLGRAEVLLKTCIAAEGSLASVSLQVKDQLAALSMNRPSFVDNSGIKSGRLLPKNVREAVNTVVPEPTSDEELVQRARKTSTLSSDVVESIRRAVAEELAQQKNIEGQSGASISETPPEGIALVSTPTVQVEKVSNHYVPKDVNQPPARPGHSSLTDFVLTILMIVGLATVGWLVYDRWIADHFFQHDPSQPIPYTTYWSSQLPSRMQVVADAAVAGDAAAELTIVQSALKGEKLPNVRSEILRMAFNPRWEHQLKPGDRKLALSLGLSDLLSEPVDDLPEISTAHPGVLLAAIVNLPLTGDVGPIGALPVRALATLSSNFRSAFAELEAIGINSFADPAARALARIMSGIVNSDSVGVFLGSGDDLIQSIARIRILLRSASNEPGVVEQLVLTLKRGQGTLSNLWNWFDQDKLKIWEQVSLQDKLAVLVGLPPETVLIPAQLADLLAFPTAHVSADALAKLSSYPSMADQKGTLKFITDSAQRLSRNQLVSLVSALADQDPSRKESLIASWFKTEPDTQFIAELLAVRAEIAGSDIFSLESARYLKDKQWKASPQLLELYMRHKELLVRALAYTRINIKDPAERKLLETALNTEPNQRLKEQLKLKLSEDLG